MSSMPCSTPHRAGRVLLRVPHRASSSAASHGLLRQECCCLACAIGLEGSCRAPAAALGQGCLVRLVPSSCVEIENPIFTRYESLAASPASLSCSTPHRVGRVLLRMPHRASSSVALHGLLRQECFCLRVCHSSGRELLRACCSTGTRLSRATCAILVRWSLLALIFALFIPTSLHIFQRPQIHSNSSF
ncbi:hypothetical protein HAX54_012432 [Datura stramonium]|uniref:Uncharacterized protein n=1 Tax=Datura stramonium TaxID=4076 RepID=A0ABS8TLL4_DATST|nr:hypothetical protein [Datura stramonium]